ncbi:O-methyltransferase, family 3 [Caldicellulosiruptor saccharolyticus DSM 8903]|uniref:tRNA 5-hydroxyuridine methyltransferase n=1 Tax=Caldicellulosiruptor saccharolyticus (strain ATCC 43494 / DSM 8903 / Tp8T 6331) TaxID=351627 RepID=A4XHX3_CALS8|nr:O-methyltransferase [Caldicellulosiruptor saccharolyticus]ABP66508.1 O-methyltransferase, family 3 [Caldicellulosiruptor saccharolyticus DSM 8903]
MDISQDILNQFIRSKLTNIDRELLKIEEYAKKHNIPIVSREVSRLLTILTMLRKPKRILEIGTAIGYSTLSMHIGFPEAKIISIEMDFDMVMQAKRNVKEFNAEDKITIIGGEAEEVLQAIDGEFDMIFFDAAKAQYIDYFNLTKDKMSKECLLVCDNVLFKGMVVGRRYLVRRKITITKRMNKFIKMIEDDPEFVMTLLPISDGVLIAIKK